MILIGIEQVAPTFNNMHIAFSTATRMNGEREPENTIDPMMMMMIYDGFVYDSPKFVYSSPNGVFALENKNDSELLHGACRV